MTPDLDRRSIDAKAQLLNLDRSDAEDSLYIFLKAAWPYIDPAPWKDAWHIDAIAEHLQAVVDGEIQKLIINLPPRHCKSLLLSVAFPAWTWAQPKNGPISGPGVAFLHASYADKLSLRDSVKCRRLIESPWYQKFWSDRFQLTSDQNTKSRFTNNKGGERLISSIGAGVTGEGGNCFVAGTTVCTPTGPVPIENLSPGDHVLSFNLQQGKVVKSRVIATAHRKTNDLCTLREVSGHQFLCTPDHPIYSPGRGFVRADSLGTGDALLVSEQAIHGSTAGNSAFGMRSVRKACEQAVVRSTQGPEAGQQRCILQQEMLLSTSRSKEFLEFVQDVWNGIIGKACEVLLGCLQGKGTRRSKEEKELPILRESLRERICILLAQMRRRCALSENAGLSEFEISSTRNGGILESVQSNASHNQAAGWLVLRELWSTCEDGSSVLSPAHLFAGTSHRREQPQQSAAESHYAVREVSSPAPSWHVTYVSKVSRDRCQEVGVYDIQVEGESNFFAEGILVHNCIIIDDPNAANDIASEATTESTIDWWQTAMPTRLNDPETGAFIIIQQRLAENDLTGHILEHEADGWTHLCLPGRYEPERSFHTSIGWTDPRTEPGQLLWPERFSEQSLKRLEVTMGPWVFAGQIQQRPEPKGGGIIKREWWKLWEPDSYPPMDFILATLDGAYTEDRMNDPSGMIVWGIFSGDVSSPTTRIVGPNGDVIRPDSTYSEFAPRVMCMYAWDSRLELHELVEKTANTCIKMKVDLLLIENKASGISVAQEVRRLYSRERFGVELFDPKSQDKAARLYSVQHLFAEGIVNGPDRPWMERVINQVAQFPKGKNDEYVDLTSMGLRKLRDMGLLVRQSEREAELESQKIYPRGQDVPLYPA